MKKYPRLGSALNHAKNTSAKCICGEIGKFKITIEWSYMRGDDDVVWACPAHKRDFNYLTDQSAH